MESPVIAPLAALLYPAILWCGVRISPLFVAVSLVVPVLGVLAVARLAHAPRARAIALLVVAAPPLFSLLGGWLDFQHAIPIGSLGVWIPLWSALAVVAATERTPRRSCALPAPRRLALAHGASASVIVLFALPHLANHLAGLIGGDTHVAVMAALRHVYRHPAVEPVLLAAVAFQVGSGAWLLRRALARCAGWPATLQVASGSYLVFFLLSHASAALRARARGGDPNWYWLAGGELLHDPWSVRLVPYYFLAVIALGVHVGCALRRLPIVAFAAGLVSTLIVIGLFRA